MNFFQFYLFHNNNVCTETRLKEGSHKKNNLLRIEWKCSVVFPSHSLLREVGTYQSIFLFVFVYIIVVSFKNRERESDRIVIFYMEQTLEGSKKNRTIKKEKKNIEEK